MEEKKFIDLLQSCANTKVQRTIIVHDNQMDAANLVKIVREQGCILDESERHIIHQAIDDLQNALEESYQLEKELDKWHH